MGMPVGCSVTHSPVGPWLLDSATTGCAGASMDLICCTSAYDGRMTVVWGYAGGFSAYRSARKG